MILQKKSQKLFKLPKPHFKYSAIFYIKSGLKHHKVESQDGTQGAILVLLRQH